MVISSAGECVIEKMLNFYSNPNFLRVILEIPHDGKHVSLRLLDHFVTNYTKNPETRVWINKCDIYDDYKNMLNGYSKNLFDPFCRDDRIVIHAYENGKRLSFEKDRKQILKMKNINLNYELRKENNTYEDGIITTIAQLHFFSWCIQRNVIQYVLAHSSKIQESMPKNNNKKKKQKSKKMIYKKEMKFKIEF